MVSSVLLNIILLSEKDNQISKNNADQGINITNKKEDILEVNIAKSVYGKSKILEIKF